MSVEIGATKQQMALCDANGKIIKLLSDKISLENGAKDVLDWIKGKGAALLGSGMGVAAIGVGFGGPLESGTGRVLVSVQVPGWKDFKLKNWFEENFNVPAVIVNDTVAGGYGELQTEAESRNFYYINIGSGIGGSLFINRKPYDGIGFGAAYTGHTYVPDWTSARPGAYRKLEDICSGFAIERRLKDKGYIPKESKLFKLCGGDISKSSCALLGQAASEGDEFSISEIDRVASTLGIALSNVITLLSVDTVSVGGGVANLGDIILDPLRRHVEELVFISAKGRYRIIQCSYLDQAVIVGAALFARDGFKVI
jgi:glucokinase